MVESTKHRFAYTINKKNYFDCPRDTVGDLYAKYSSKILKSDMAQIVPAISIEEDFLQKILPALKSVRDNLSDYQEKRGIPKEATYTFIAMLQAVGEHLYLVMTVMITMLSNLLPITDVFLVMLRFLIDKLIEIVEARDSERVMKTCVFVLEIVPLIFLLLFIYGFVLYPLSSMFTVVIFKIFNFVL